MMAVEPFLFSGPVNQKHKRDRCDRPVSNRPIEQGSSFQEEPCGEFPDLLHGTPPGKVFAFELCMIMMITRRALAHKIYVNKGAKKTLSKMV